MNISIVACMENSRGIGMHGKIPWKSKIDLAFFKSMTYGKTVIMGSKTWLSLKDYLPNRNNFILSKSHLKLKGNAVQFASIQQCIEECKQRKLDDIYVIGGATIYEKFIEMKICKYIYLNIINDNYSCDVYMPRFEHLYKLIESYNIENITFNKYELICV